jgi:hypothetical protein
LNLNLLLIGLSKVFTVEKDILSQDKILHKGIGLKRLKGDYWEIRKGLKARILFRWEGDLVEFVLAGDHNDIKRFLKNI